MTVTAKRAQVPKLRFPEFRDAGAWEDDKLGSVCELYQPVTLSASELSMTGKYLVYGANGIIGTHDEYNHEESEIAVTCRGATCGEVTITEPRSWITGNAMVVKPRTKDLRKDFVFQYFKNHGLKSVISGSAQPQITRAGFSPLVLFFPEPAEQQKIADCLSSLDELITLETQKLDALKTHKKGLMQELFPAEGETVPRLRFPEFWDAGEWEEKRLGDIGSVRMCKRILKEQTSPRGDIPFYKIGTFGGIPDAYISREIFENFRNSYPFPKNGAILISAAGTIGRTVRYKGELAYFQDSNIVWLDNNEKLIADNFLFYLYQLINWAPSVGAIQRLYNENLLGTQVKFPSIPEQQKIADCLASLDDLITVQTQQLAALKTHKKGLMQQLFPVLDEVSA